MQRTDSISRSALIMARGGESALEGARARLQDVRSKRASLQAEIERMRGVPTNEEVEASRMAGVHPMPPQLIELSKRVNAAEEKCILHRSTGWTVFEIDLDIGRRQRQQRRAEGPSKAGKAALGLGVRIDTFWRGRFYEPYYLVFAKRSQMLATGEQVTGAALDAAMPEASFRNESSDDDGNAKKPREDGQEAVRLLRHTIPHFIPLQSLVERYLGRGGLAPKRKRGGFDLLDGLMSRDGLWLFLGHLHTYLQAFVSRREQVIALQSLRIPGVQERAHLEAYGNDAFDQVSVHCRMGLPSQSDVHAYEEEEGIDRAEYERLPGAKESIREMHERDRIKVAKTEKRFGQMALTIKINLQFTDLTADHIGQLVTVTESLREQSKNESVCQFGSVSVECARPSRKTSECEHVRRPDYEEIASGSGEVDLDEAVSRILSTHHRRQTAAKSEMDLLFLEEHAKKLPESEQGSVSNGQQSASGPRRRRRLFDAIPIRPKRNASKRSRHTSNSDEET